MSFPESVLLNLVEKIGLTKVCELCREFLNKYAEDESVLEDEPPLINAPAQLVMDSASSFSSTDAVLLLE